MADIIINAVGDKCPIPVVKATQAIRALRESAVITVEVDNEIAVQNLTRLAASKGFPVSSEKKNDALYAVVMQAAPVAAEEEESAMSCDANENLVVVVHTDTMGHGDDKLGKQLLKGCIYAISQLEKLPRTMLFYNGGAHLTCEGSESLEDLKNMEAQGVEILTCGTCLNFYGLADKLAVGSVTNMYAIVEKLAGASKIIKP